MNPTRQMTRVSALLIVVGAMLLPAPAEAARTILRMRLDGPVLESPSESAGLMALLEESQVLTLRDMVSSIRDAGRDGDVDGLVLIIESPLMSLAQVEGLTRAINEFQSHGKPVHVFMDYGGNLSYALAATADEITLAENGELALLGLNIELMYMKGLFDKIGVEFQMLRCGDYKSFVEPYTRTEPSAEAAENVNWLLDSLYERWIDLIATGRGLPPEKVRALVDQGPLNAEQALEHKLVTHVSSFHAFKQRLYEDFGSDVVVLKRYEKQPAVSIDINNPFAMFEIFTRMFEGVTEPLTPGIGLVYVDGPIMVGTSDESPFGGSTIAGSTTLRAALEEARSDENIRAVVLRVNSPGGSALASDIIWQAATRCAEQKPLIVSMGGVAGSGGYYVAVPGRTVFAEPSTITGSIGVGGGKFVWAELMEDKLGLTFTEFSRGKHAGLMSPNHKWTESERTRLQDYMERVYDQFKQRIRTSRGDRLHKELDEIAGGRVYTGAQAVELGLVDKLGGLQDALDMAAREAALGDDYQVHVLPRPSELTALVNMLQSISGEDGDDEFEIALRTRLQGTSLLGAALPVLSEFAPQQTQEILRTLQNMVMLQREHIGCFMPIVPQVR